MAGAQPRSITLRPRSGAEWGSHSPQANPPVLAVIWCERLEIFTILCYTDLKKKYDFYILDLYHDEEMLAVSKEDYQRYMRDKVHPTLVGYREWWTPKFIDFLENAVI